jgi:hypothetical protein
MEAARRARRQDRIVYASLSTIVPIVMVLMFA